MAALLHLPFVTHAPAPQISGANRAMLNRLRLVAAPCRQRSHMAEATPDRLEFRTLLTVLESGLSDGPWFHAPGAKQLSFDESWLFAAICAQARGDVDSVAFLVQRRLPVSHHRLMTAVLQQFADGNCHAF